MPYIYKLTVEKLAAFVHHRFPRTGGEALDEDFDQGRSKGSGGIVRVGELRRPGRHIGSSDDEGRVLSAMLPISGIAASAGPAVSTDHGRQHTGRCGGRSGARRADWR